MHMKKENPQNSAGFLGTYIVQFFLEFRQLVLLELTVVDVSWYD